MLISIWGVYKISESETRTQILHKLQHLSQSIVRFRHQDIFSCFKFEAVFSKQRFSIGITLIYSFDKQSRFKPDKDAISSYDLNEILFIYFKMYDIKSKSSNDRIQSQITQSSEQKISSYLMIKYSKCQYSSRESRKIQDFDKIFLY